MKYLLTLFVCICIIIPTDAKEIDQIINFLNSQELTRQTPDQIKENKSPWGTLQSQDKNEDDGWIFSTGSTPYLLEVVFAFDGDHWLFNDATISIFSEPKNCQKNMATLITRFTKKLGPPKAENEAEGSFWQLKEKEWGIWVSRVETIHPKTRANSCAARAILAYGADEYLLEDDSF